jgi:hypothetical protein
MLGHGGLATTGLVAETSGPQTFTLPVSTATFTVTTNPVLFRVQQLVVVQTYNVTTQPVIFRINMLEAPASFAITTQPTLFATVMPVAKTTYTLTFNPVRDQNDYPQTVMIVHGAYNPKPVDHSVDHAAERRKAAKEARAAREAKAKQDKQAQLALKRKKAKEEAEKQAQLRSEAEARAREEFELRKSQFPPPAEQWPFGKEIPLDQLRIPGLGQPPAGAPTGAPLAHYGAMADEVMDMQDALMAIHAINQQITEQRDVEDALLAVSIVQPR